MFHFYSIFFFISLSGLTLKAMDLGIETTVFNVRQGSGAVLRDRHKGTSFIVDAGYSGENVETLPLLHRFNAAIFGKGGYQKKERLRGILLSHADGDHIKLLTRVIHSNSRAFKEQNKQQHNRISVYLGSPFNEYLVGDGVDCLNALISVNATLRPLSHIITSEEASTKTMPIPPIPRPFFMNALIPEFSDSTRGLLTVIMVANASYKGEGKFLGTIENPGHLDDAAPNLDTQIYGGKNDNGAILKLTYKEKHIVFPGDVDGKYTDNLLINVPELIRSNFLSTHVLLAAHHGAERERTNNLPWLLISD